MRYYKTVEDGYILAIGTGGGGVEITQEEYEQIMGVIQSKPLRTETADYHLKEDLTWEAYERIDPPAEELDIDDSEALQIITGGDG